MIMCGELGEEPEQKDSLLQCTIIHGIGTAVEKTGEVMFEEAMEMAGFGKYSIFIIFLSALTLFTSLLGSADVSFLMPAAECDLQLSSQDKGMLGSAFFIGMIASCHISGFLSDTLGRRHVLVRGLFLNVFTYIVGAFSPHFWMLFALKVFSGVLSCPTMIATFPFLGEYLPTSRRAQGVLIATALSFTSLLFSSLIGWLTLTEVWHVEFGFVTLKPWRLFYLICGLPGLLCAILYYSTSESPRFLITRGKKEEAIKVLQKIYTTNTGNPAENYPVNSIVMDSDEVVPPIQGKGAMGVLKHIFDQTSPLFRKPHVKNLMLCVILMFMSFLCLNSVLLWLPEVTNRIALSQKHQQGNSYMCQMVMTHYSANKTSPQQCSEAIDVQVFLPNIILGIVFPCVMLLASVLIKLLERKLILVVLMVVNSGCCLALTWVPYPPPLHVILFGAVPVLSGICYNIICSILIELFPTYIRAMAVSLTIICGRLGSIVGSQMFSYLIDSHCLLLFKLIAILLICNAPIPFCFQLKSKKHQLATDCNSEN